MDHTEEIDASDQSKIGDLIMLMYQSAETAVKPQSTQVRALAGARDLLGTCTRRLRGCSTVVPRNHAEPAAVGTADKTY